MIPEIGLFCLILSACLAMIQAFVPLYGAYFNIPRLMMVAVNMAYGQFLFLLAAFLILVYCFVTDDFSVLYVSQNSNSLLPVQYKVSAVWGAHEGSLLLWVFILSGWTAAVAKFSKNLPDIFKARVLAVLALISIGFIWFILQTSNPFARLMVVPLDGNDLNPLLQDPGLIIHPPLLYMGYVGFAVAFSFAISALLGGQLDSTWARWSRPWTLIAWMFLTIGITLGSWWAYYELGWGGWWFWDPVENASFMPWILGTALVHSLIVSEKRNVLKSWTVLLAIFTFSLSLLGTFLVRSGVLVSVHAFATDPARGEFILKYLMVVVGGSLLLYAFRAAKVKSTGQFRLFSREMLLLLANVGLSVVTFFVLLGTLYPLIVDFMGWEKQSVGPPYFNKIFAYLMTPLLLFMALTPFLKWKSDVINSWFRPFLLLLIVVLTIYWFIYDPDMGFQLWQFGVLLGSWVITGTALYFLKRWAALDFKWAQLPRATIGMVSAHTGIGVCLIGIVMTTHFGIERNIAMQLNETIEIKQYQITFEQLRKNKNVNYIAYEGHFRVKKGLLEVAYLRPEKRNYYVRNMPMTEAAIDAGFFRDIYIALGDQLEGGAWAVRIYHKPFIRWIWLGALLIALGAWYAATDKRYRKTE